MDSDDPHFTYNELSNEDKELLLRNGYRPGELDREDEQELLRDLREQEDGDFDNSHLSSDVSADERDGTE